MTVRLFEHRSLFCTKTTAPPQNQKTHQDPTSYVTTRARTPPQGFLGPYFPKFERNEACRGVQVQPLFPITQPPNQPTKLIASGHLWSVENLPIHCVIFPSVSRRGEVHDLPRLRCFHSDAGASRADACWMDFGYPTLRGHGGTCFAAGGQ